MSKQSLKPPSLLPASQGHAILLPQSLVNITHSNAEPHLMLQLYSRQQGADYIDKKTKF